LTHLEKSNNITLSQIGGLYPDPNANFTIMTDFGNQAIVEELQHMISSDSKGNRLEGGNKYKLHLPSNIPASEFWSIIVYDSQSQLIIHNGQPWPSVYSSEKNLFYNRDGSVDAWFGPEHFDTEEINWVKTIPGKQWYMIMRLYYPLESWHQNKWRPGEIEEIL
jgi:hypothetical protein